MANILQLAPKLLLVARQRKLASEETKSLLSSLEDRGDDTEEPNEATVYVHVIDVFLIWMQPLHATSNFKTILFHQVSIELYSVQTLLYVVEIDNRNLNWVQFNDDLMKRDSFKIQYLNRMSSTFSGVDHVAQLVERQTGKPKVVG